MTKRDSPMGEYGRIEVFFPGNEPETSHQRIEPGGEVIVPSDDEKEVHIHEQDSEVAHHRTAAVAPIPLETAVLSSPGPTSSSNEPSQNFLRVATSSPLAPAKPKITGSRRRAFYQVEDVKESAPPRTAADVRDVLAEALVEVRSGKIDLGLANAITSLGTALLRVLEVADIEERLKALEQSFEMNQKEKAASEEEPPARIYQNLPTEITVEIPE